MKANAAVVVGVYSFLGVDQNSPVPTTNKINDCTGTTNPSISITTANANSWAIDSPSIYGGKTLSAPQTPRWNINGVAGGSGKITGASSSTLKSTPGLVNFGWTSSAFDKW